MKIRYLLSILIVFIFILVNCDKSTRNVYHGKKISFYRDSLILYNDSFMPDSINNRKRSYIITYLKMNCPSCVEDIYKWISMANHYEEFNKVNIIFILYGEPSEYTYSYLVGNNNIEFPIFWDKDNTFLKSNNLMILEFEKTILVGKDSTILLMGNPLNDKKLFKKFLNQINNN